MDLYKTTLIDKPKPVILAESCPIESRPQIIYPTRKPFQRYLEELVNLKTGDDQPVLVKREQPDYLKASRIHGNPFKFIRFERINQLREREQQRKDEDAQRNARASGLSEKLPFAIRQRNTAASNVRNLIHEENLQEINTFGRLFGPNSLTAQPINSKFYKLPKSTTRMVSQAQTLSLRAQDEVNESKGLTDDPKSSEIETDSHEQVSKGEPVQGPSRSPSEKEVGKPKPEPEMTPKPTKPFEGVKTFVPDRRRVCLLELAVRTKRGEVKRLDTILKAESEFLKKQEQELLRRHEEHDRYLKSICQRTAEAIRLAEGEARKRNEITERIKRARYRLAHLNAECVKLEEEYIRLSTYKEFLRKVADTFREHHTQLKSPTNQPNPPFSLSVESDGLHSVPAEICEPDLGPAEATISITQGRLSSQSTDTEAVSLIDFFSNPQDLVDILSELESNNLTLIENVQEQEEVCERVRAKANKLYKLLNAERDMVDGHIEREKQNIAGIRDNVKSIVTAQNTLSDFVLLERYAKVFHLGDIQEFENMESTFLTAGSTEKPKHPTGKDTQSKVVKELTNAEPTDTKPTISNLLSILQHQIQRVYCAVYGTNEGGARLDTLVMLRRLETTVDELSEMLNAYPKHLVLKAKRTVDERNRVSARRRQKFEGRLAYERRLQKAILKAREGPRWRFGRRVLERSRPPEVRRSAVVGAVDVESEEDNKSLFTA
ncbi:Coiled-coil domain-containing protein 37 [Paragonimus heterotremus]|uniref:Coiled-coil domain-containing protein 37 n=1 Tax=Paragonimus heterotremus TaxID=100268 RepID=A0A8J4WJB1_9TREM|nr:Coiled-coil domain-containing protein 37 [Paragonimus heterotremus]